MRTGSRYDRYSAEQHKIWDEAEERHSKFMIAHTHEKEMVFENHGFYIVCIQRKYDKCIDKKNEYGIQVWLTEDRTNPENCLENQWFDTPQEANETFVRFKETF